MHQMEVFSLKVMFIRNKKTESLAYYLQDNLQLGERPRE